MIRSPTSLADVLDGIMAGRSWHDAMESVGGTESAGWVWKRQSKLAAASGEFDSPFYFAWPSGAKPDYFHNLVDRARARRGAMLKRVREATIIDGKIASDEFGLSLSTKPTPAPTRRELKPSSYSGNKPKSPAPIPAGNALTDYIKAASPLEKDLRDRAARLADPGRITKPSAMVHIEGRGGVNDPPERISNPSNQEGLPTHADDAPRDARPQPQAQPDYSRRTTARVDTGGIGYGSPPRGGFRVA
jgi:hypothetical protein